MNHKQQAYEQGQKEASQGKLYRDPVTWTRDLTTTSERGRQIIKETRESYNKGRDNAWKRTTWW